MEIYILLAALVLLVFFISVVAVVDLGPGRFTALFTVVMFLIYLIANIGINHYTPKEQNKQQNVEIKHCENL